MKPFLFLTCMFVTLNCMNQTNQSKSMVKFPVLDTNDLPGHINWISILNDDSNDGKRSEGADAKSLAYYFDSEENRIWFKIETYEELSSFPALSISIDTDADQETGVNWYGYNKSFTFEKMISVGPVRMEDGSYFGYNGITDEEGVRRRDWINHKKGVVDFYMDTASIFVFSVNLADIDVKMQKINLIGSVGDRAIWNDDIGDNNFATIILE